MPGRLGSAEFNCENSNQNTHKHVESKVARLRARHGDSIGENSSLTRMFKIFKPADEDEVNAFNVTIDGTMSKHDVMNKVLDVIQNIH